MVSKKSQTIGSMASRRGRMTDESPKQTMTASDDKMGPMAWSSKWTRARVGSRERDETVGGGGGSVVVVSFVRASQSRSLSSFFPLWTPDLLDIRILWAREGM